VSEWTHTPKWAPTLRVRVPMDFWIFRKEFQGKKTSLDWKVPYTIRKLLECRCLKWACTSHLSTWNTSYGWKKGWELSCQFDSIWLPTTKSLELPWFICVQVACDISLEISQWGLQLCFGPHLNQRFAQKNMGLQSRGNPNFANFANFKTPNLGVRDKMTFRCSPYN